jgi:hypothetical protein
MLSARSPAPEANCTRAINDVFANQADFVISQEGAWSDDFDHGNITESGWSTQGFCTDFSIWRTSPPNITAEDKTMRVYSKENWSEAWRTSNVAYGSWAFDVYCADTKDERSYIAFVSGSPVLVPEDKDFPFEYGIITVVGQYESYNSAFLLYRRPSTRPDLVVIGSHDVEEVSGWWHINITRDFDGNFEVYFNDTLGITVNDPRHTTSDLFTFTAQAPYALDNIVVVPKRDDVGPVIGNHDRTPSTPDSTESVSVNVSVTDMSGVDTVILSYYNGATWFNITMTGAEPDYEGTIPALPHGTEVQYRVYANDTIDNWSVSETDSYTVTDPPTTVLLVIGGGIALVVVLAVVIRFRK